MELRDILILGGYAYTTLFGGALYKMIEKLRYNHLKHTQDALNETRAKVNLPPVDLCND